jgi:hypothetical protein
VIARDFPAPEWRQVFLFLTKRGDEPSEEDGAGWQSLPLETVVDSLERILSKGSGHPDARMMLGAYLGMLRRNHLTDPRLDELARSLWREHREVLEFLISRRPDAGSGVFASLIENQSDVAERFSNATNLKVVPDQSSKFFVRFAITDWDEVPGMLTGTGWKPSNRLLLFEITRDTKGIVRCKFALGPGEEKEREIYFEALKAAGADIGWNSPLTPKWRTLAAKTISTPSDEDEVGELCERVIEGAAQFLKMHVPKYDEVARKLILESA